MIPLVSPSQVLLACSVCWGADPSSLAGANAGVGLMLVFLLFVLSCFLYFIFYLARRARHFAAEDAVGMNPHP